MQTTVTIPEPAPRVVGLTTFGRADLHMIRLRRLLPDLTPAERAYIADELRELVAALAPAAD